MVPRSPRIVALLAPLVTAGGCDPLDRVEIVAGDHCASDLEDQEVACVLDGDTLMLGVCDSEDASAITVRLLGVDAPEIEHPDQAEECYGPESAAYLSDLLTGEVVTLRFDAECTDKYERTLAYVYLLDDTGEEVLINALVIREGYATVYEDFDDILLADLLYSSQEAAQRESLGIWAECL